MSGTHEMPSRPVLDQQEIEAGWRDHEGCADEQCSARGYFKALWLWFCANPAQHRPYRETRPGGNSS
ncbi:hypothetical protein [Nocardia sp. NBC_00511]|uniref:hypothetical protein n=1 Tax=Nocardia sp. NBC_00511 TaxID=2903591 RepID=UPI0030E2206D